MMEEQNKKTIGRLFPLAIVLIICSEIVRNLYYILTVDVNSIDITKAAGYVVLILYIIALRAIIPGLIDMFITFIIGSSLSRRGFREIMSRKDFITITLFFLSGVNVIAGGIDLIGFVSDTVYIYSVALAEVVLVSIAFAIEYFAIIAPKLNKYRKKNIVFGVMSTILLVWQAIVTAGPCLVVILIYYYQNMPELAELFADYKYAASDVVPCSIALGFYALVLIGILVYKSILNKKAVAEAKDEAPIIPDYQERPQPQQKPQEPERDPFEEVDDWERVDKGDTTNANTDDSDPFNI